jgi:hypothetical protein
VARQRGIGFPGIGRRGADLPALDDARRIAALEDNPRRFFCTV